MPTRFIVLILLLANCSCSDNEFTRTQRLGKKIVDSAIAQGSRVNTIENPVPKNLRFDFTAAYYDSFKTIEIDAVIYNDNSHPVYFLSHNCRGSKDYLLYKQSLFSVAGPKVYCNSTMPVKAKIEPHGKYSVHEVFVCRKQVKSIKLGFDFTPLTPNAEEATSDNFHFINRMEFWAEKPINTETAYQRSHMADYL